MMFQTVASGNPEIPSPPIWALPLFILVLFTPLWIAPAQNDQSAENAAEVESMTEQDLEKRRAEVVRRLSWRRSQMSDEDFARNGFVNMCFDKFVFPGPDLPEPRYENAEKLAQLMDGTPTFEVTYYGPDAKETHKADQPGRYGARILCDVGDGETREVLRTLYCVPKEQEIPAGQTDEDTAMKLAWEAELGREITPEDMPPASRAEFWWYEVDEHLGQAPEYDYFTLAPPDADEQEAWPLLIYLHGAGAIRIRDIEEFRADPFFDRFADTENRAKPFAGYIVVPLANGGWRAPAVEKLVDRVVRELPIDPQRIYLTGFSMGSGGTLSTAVALPERFAAIATVAGGALPPERSYRLRNLPTWAFYGEDDKPWRWPRHEERLKEMQQEGIPIRYTLLPEANHLESRNQAYAMPELYQWFLQHTL